MKKLITAIALVGTAIPAATVAGVATTKYNCASINKKLVTSEGFSKATGPKVTKYDYKHAKKNAATPSVPLLTLALRPSLWVA